MIWLGLLSVSGSIVRYGTATNPTMEDPLGGEPTLRIHCNLELLLATASALLAVSWTLKSEVVH
jgi:hypothetical protein